MTRLNDFTMDDWPFPHVIVDGLWEDEHLATIVDEFPQDGWRSYQNANERKMESASLGPATTAFFDMLGSEEFRNDLSELTGIEGLTMEIVGGGYHLIPPGGRLAVHTDFNRSPATGRYRRLNLLVYLNRDWDDEGGCLELWSEDREDHISVPPEFNRTVVFETSSRSWHGHPVPAQRWRRSVAAYYYTEQPPADFAVEQSTVWMS